MDRRTKFRAELPPDTGLSSSSLCRSQPEYLPLRRDPGLWPDELMKSVARRASHAASRSQEGLDRARDAAGSYSVPRAIAKSAFTNQRSTFINTRFRGGRRPNNSDRLVRTGCAGIRPIRLLRSQHLDRCLAYTVRWPKFSNLRLRDIRYPQKITIQSRSISGS